MKPKKIKAETLPKLTKSEQAVAVILIDELQRWESTTAVSIGEFFKLVKRIGKLF